MIAKDPLPGQRWIGPHELRVGHRIYGWRSQISLLTFFSLRSHIVVTGLELDKNGCSVVEPDLGHLEGYDWLIDDLCAVEVKPPSLWNGTCSRCGKGTYTSCFSVEHEGGPCP